MKQNWELDELIEYWTLLPDELALLGNKTGTTRLGCAVFLKYFQIKALFPPIKPEIPAVIINHVASQVGVPPDNYQQYDWSGRTAMYHRYQIREFFGFRKAKVSDAQALVDWLSENVLPREAELEHLKEIVKERFRDLKIEPPTPGRIERLIRSALQLYEGQFFSSALQKLSRLMPECH